MPKLVCHPEVYEERRARLHRMLEIKAPMVLIPHFLLNTLDSFYASRWAMAKSIALGWARDRLLYQKDHWLMWWHMKVMRRTEREAEDRTFGKFDDEAEGD